MIYYLQVGARLMVTRAGLLDALRADPGGGPALQEGMELGVLLGVLGAESAAPRLRFLVLRAEAKGKCLFHTCADADRFFSNRRALHRGEPDFGRLLSAITLV